MNSDYKNFNPEDFCHDESFRNWVLNPDPPTELYWNEWISQNPASAGKIETARALLLALQEKAPALTDQELDAITQQILNPANNSTISFWQKPFFRIAATLAIIAGAGMLAFKLYTEKEKLAFFETISPNLTADYIETENTENQTQTITLQDSSVITLYPKSKIRYPIHFSPETREVYLEGQAFFNIAKNPKRPFWVYTNHISTQVLGTSFMVKAFENEKNVKVEVRTGRVSVYRYEDLQKAKRLQNNEMAGIILTPNQSIEYTVNEARLLKSISRQPEILVAKTPENFIFDEAPISKVFSQMERAYGIQIIYDEKNMKNCYLTATFTEESLYEKLNIICKVTHSSYEIVDAQIVIHSNGC
ncbi:FecR family protein [Emticicia sp. 21SJ11W-3]|uniref:FecR family protein n=1 Tax=Emticicia sp. 21SJ11W-3 TaxID=2916755 RepID=UPI0020A1DB35|nr:FecR family protein [Emticicia sp. 21SJ11W-3]UTA66834.1 FecR family protein [Emticicia sp. 21SJ11W-3]